MGPLRQNAIQRTVRTAHLSVLMTVHNFQYTIQHRTVLIISPLTSRRHDSVDDYALATAMLHQARDTQAQTTELSQVCQSPREKFSIVQVQILSNSHLHYAACVPHIHGESITHTTYMMPQKHTHSEQLNIQ